MTPEQQLDLLEQRPLRSAPHWIPSDRIRFVAMSTDRRWLARLERWWKAFVIRRIEYAEAQAAIEAQVQRD